MSPLALKEKVHSYTLKEPCVSNATFYFYCIFLFEFFLKLSQRIPGVGVLRPTLLLVLVITILLISQKKILLKRESNSISLAIKALIIYLIFTLPFVSYPGSVLKSNLAIFVKAIVFFYFTACCVDTRSRLNKFLIVYVGCQVFRVVEPLFLNITEGYWGSSTYMGGGEFANRLAGAPHDVINPNELGFVIATCIPFLHFLLFPRSTKYKIIYGVLMVCMLYALILTMSRGAFLALLVVAVIIFRESNYKFFLIIVGFFIAIAGWSVMNPVQKDRYLSLVSSEAKGSKTVDGRFNGMIGEFSLGLRRPIFGHGLGTTPEAKYHFQGYRQASHNLYAELLIEIGAVGMFLFLKILFEIRKTLTSLKSKISEVDVLDERVAKVLLCVFFMYLVYSTNYWGLSQSYWYLLAGLAVAFNRIVRLEKE